MAKNEGSKLGLVEENLSALHFAFYNANKREALQQQNKPKRTFTLSWLLQFSWCVTYRNGRLVPTAPQGLIFANATSPTSVPSFMIFMAFMSCFSIVYWISLNCWLLSSFHFFQSSEASYAYFGQLAWKEPPKMATKRGKITYCGIKIVTFKSS